MHPRPTQRTLRSFAAPRSEVGYARHVRRVGEPVELRDLLPTIRAIGDIDMPESVQGESVLPLAAADTDGWRKYVRGPACRRLVQGPRRQRRVTKFPVAAPPAVVTWESAARRGRAEHPIGGR